MRILFFTPCKPQPTGYGLAMRAHAVAEALRRLGDVVVSEGPWRGNLNAFTRVHAFRFATVQYVKPFLGKVPCDLDLDELESTTRRRLGHPVQAIWYRWRERRWLPRFRRVYVASEVERAGLPGLADVRVLPNTVVLPVPRIPHVNARPIALFVGNPNYAPNKDAVAYIIRHLAPRVPEVDFYITGGRPARTANVRWLGYVEDLDALYRRVDVAIAPIFAGGGTRIKALEAMSYGLPLVATPTAMEGLVAEAGKEWLDAATPEAFVDRIRTLLEQPSLRSRLGCAARERIASHYTPDVLPAILED